MNCPYCGSKSAVVDSRPRISGTLRRRKCKGCTRRFSTQEIVTTIIEVDTDDQYTNWLKGKDAKDGFPHA